MIDARKIAYILFTATVACFAACVFAVPIYAPAHADGLCAEHTYGETVTVDSTCWRAGRRYRECTVCGYTDIIERLDLAPHSGEWRDVVFPTCIDEGYRILVCTVCGETVQQEYTPKTDHITSPHTSQEATCTEEGLVYMFCHSCGKYVSIEHIAPLGHDYKKTVITQPSPVAVGKIKYECALCHDGFTVSDMSLIWVIPVSVIGAALMTVGIVNYIRASIHCPKK